MPFRSLITDTGSHGDTLVSYLSATGLFAAQGEASRPKKNAYLDSQQQGSAECKGSEGFAMTIATIFLRTSYLRLLLYVVVVNGELTAMFAESGYRINDHP